MQYGRANIESANKKRGIIDHSEEDDEDPEPEPADYKPDTPPAPKKNGIVKKLSQNNIAYVISKESRILYPEGGEGHSAEKVDQKEQVEAVLNNNNENGENGEQQVINV